MSNRERFSSQNTFLLSCIGAAIGLGNLWRYSYIAANNGGGTFLIPYILSLCILGFPLLLLELSLGIRYQASILQIYKEITSTPLIAKAFSIMIAICAMVIASYYAVIMTWCWRYFMNSFDTPLPWKQQEEEYFYTNILKTDYPNPDESDINNTTSFASMNVVYSCLIWSFVFLCICKGVKSSGWVVWVTVPLPFILLIILFFRGITLEGASIGIKYYMEPEWSKILKPRVWADAASQIFFSLSLATGVMPCFASYRETKQSVVKDVLIIGIVNSITSIISGFAIFGILGHLAHKDNVAIEEVVKSGPGLVFIAIPSAVTQMPAENFFSICFFLMLLTLGIDSAFALLEGFTTIVKELLDTSTYKNPAAMEVLVALLSCIVGFLMSLIYLTNTGIYWMELVDHYVSIFLLIPIGIMEIYLIYKYYDMNSILNEVIEMTNIRFSVTKWSNLLKVAFVVLIIILVAEIINEMIHPLARYPVWSIIIGWFFTLGILISTVIYVIIKLKFSPQLHSPLANVKNHHQIELSENA